MKKQFILLYSFLFFALINHTSCITSSVEDTRSSSEIAQFENLENILPKWNKLNTYSEYFDFYLSEPKTFCHALKVDLASKDLKICFYPTSSSLKPCRAKTFATKNKCTIAFNTTQYSQKIVFLSEKKPVGIIKTNDFQFSDPNKNYCALCLAQSENGIIGKITSNQPSTYATNNNSFFLIQGGFWQILENGNIIDFKDIKDSRTCVGLTHDNKTLFILIVEGEKKSKSVGLSYNDCAHIMKNFGAYNAMQFDGGSSTCLFINGKNALSYSKNPILPAFLGFSTK